MPEAVATPSRRGAGRHRYESGPLEDQRERLAIEDPCRPYPRKLTRLTEQLSPCGRPSQRLGGLQ